MERLRLTAEALELIAPWNKQKYYIVCEILSKKIEPEYAPLAGRRPKNFCHKTGYTKYKKTFVRIWDFLIEAKGCYHNSMESLIEHYLASIYKRHGHYGSTPFVTQLGPSEKNQDGFFIHIHRIEEASGEEFWCNNKPDYEGARERARKHREGNLSFNNPMNLNIIET